MINTAFQYVFLSLLIFINLLWGKNGQAHKQDVLDAFGAARLSKNAQECLCEIAEGFSIYIDDYNESFAIRRRREDELNKLLDEIKKIAPNFKMSITENDGNSLFLSHRIFFHCGFNKPVKESVGLRKCVDACTNDSKISNEIYNLVQKEQNARNRKMMDCVKKAIIHHSQNQRVNLSRAKVNAIAALVYDIHILGDYEESNGTETALAPLENVVGDIINAVRDLKPNREILKKFENKINISKNSSAMKTGQYGSAANILNQCLKVMLPEVIKNTPDVRKALWLY